MTDQFELEVEVEVLRTALVIAPFFKLTSLGGAVLPEKNSPAERAGSDEGANG